MDEEVSQNRRRERRARVKREFEDVVFSFWRNPEKVTLTFFFWSLLTFFPLCLMLPHPSSRGNRPGWTMARKNTYMLSCTSCSVSPWNPPSCPFESRCMGPPLVSHNPRDEVGCLTFQGLGGLSRISSSCWLGLLFLPGLPLWFAASIASPACGGACSSRLEPSSSSVPLHKHKYKRDPRASGRRF